MLDIIVNFESGQKGIGETLWYPKAPCNGLLYCNGVKWDYFTAMESNEKFKHAYSRQRLLHAKLVAWWLHEMCALEKACFLSTCGMWTHLGVFSAL